MKKFLSIGALLLTVWLVQACRGIDMLDVVVPVHSYRAERAIAYGGHPRQQLDIYIPGGEDAPEMSAPVIVFFYGGSWQRGAKEEYRFVGESFASRGYVVVIADYRLYPEVRFPAFVEDSARATRWVRDHIEAYGGDEGNIYLAGHSAGAYNAVMLALDPRYLAAQGVNPRDIRGVIGLSGPYDFLPIHRNGHADEDGIAALFDGAPEDETQPVKLHHIAAPMPEIFLATGGADDLVKPENTTHLADRLMEGGFPVETHVYEAIDHRGVAQALASAFTGNAPVVADVTAFIERTRHYAGE